MLMILLLCTGCRMKAVGFRQGFRSQDQMWRMGFEVLLAVVFSQLSLSTAAFRRSCAVNNAPYAKRGRTYHRDPTQLFHDQGCHKLCTTDVALDMTGPIIATQRSSFMIRAAISFARLMLPLI